jgi:RNA polymerase sigma factor (sigma-70 family)
MANPDKIESKKGDYRKTASPECRTLLPGPRLGNLNDQKICAGANGLKGLGSVGPIRAIPIPKQPILRGAEDHGSGAFAVVCGSLFGDRSMSSFAELLQRVRRGDDDAANDIFRTYEPHVKRLVRHLMRIETIRFMAEPSDVCQSVMASFFTRVALGQYDLANPEQLAALLKRMARNKVVDFRRSPDRRISFVPVAGPELSGIEPPDPAKGPASQVMWRDLLHEIRERFTDAERRVSELRAEGLGWEDVGKRLGEPADAVRKRLNRALRRVGNELKLAGWSDD